MCFETFTYNLHIYSWNHIWQLVKVLGTILAVFIHVSLCLVIPCQGSEGSPPPCCIWLHGEERPAMDIDMQPCTWKCWNMQKQVYNEPCYISKNKHRTQEGATAHYHVSKIASAGESLDHTWKNVSKSLSIYLSFISTHLSIYIYLFFYFSTAHGNNENHCQYTLRFRLQSFWFRLQSIWLQQRPLIQEKNKSDRNT